VCGKKGETVTFTAIGERIFLPLSSTVSPPSSSFWKEARRKSEASAGSRRRVFKSCSSTDRPFNPERAEKLRSKRKVLQGPVEPKREPRRSRWKRVQPLPWEKDRYAVKNVIEEALTEERTLAIKQKPRKSRTVAPGEGKMVTVRKKRWKKPERRQGGLRGDRSRCKTS